MPERSTSTVDTAAEYALYLLAVRHPAEFADAQRFTPKTLAENRRALEAVKAMLRFEEAERLREAIAEHRDGYRADHELWMVLDDDARRR